MRTVELSEGENEFIQSWYRGKFSKAIHELLKEQMKDVVICSCGCDRVYGKDLYCKDLDRLEDLYTCPKCHEGYVIPDSAKTIRDNTSRDHYRQKTKEFYDKVHLL